MTESRPRLPWLQRVAFAVAPLTFVYYLAAQLGLMGTARSRGEITGSDFINFWSGSYLLLKGRIFEIFDPAQYALALQQLWGPGLAIHVFSYPPSFLPFILWTGTLPYGVALCLWDLTGVVALLAAAWPLSRKPFVAAAILFSPAVLACLDASQTGLITAALLIGGLRLVDRRPWLAGLLIGLVSIKPQLGLLIAVALCAAGRWRTIGGAALSVTVLALAGFALAGEQGWELYVRHTLPVQTEFMNHGSGIWRTQTPSPLSAAIAAGLPFNVARAVQAICTIFMAILIFRHFRKVKNEERRINEVDVLILVAAGFVASPYSFHYDMPSLVLALILACIERPDLDSVCLWRWGVALLWTVPIIMVICGTAAMMMGAHLLPVGLLMTMSGLAMVWLGAQKSAAKA